MDITTHWLNLISGELRLGKINVVHVDALDVTRFVRLFRLIDFSLRKCCLPAPGVQDIMRAGHPRARDEDERVTAYGSSRIVTYANRLRRLHDFDENIK